MKKLFLLTFLALAFPVPASAYNMTDFEEHWPSTVSRVNGCDVPTHIRCIGIYNHTGFPYRWVRRTLKPALADFNSGGTRHFRWVFHRGARINLNSQAGIETAYRRRHFGGIVIGYAGCGSTLDEDGNIISKCGAGNWEVDVQFGGMEQDPAMGDLPDWYAAPDSVSHNGFCFVAVDNRTRTSIEHELGHCMGLEHWPLLDVAGWRNYECSRLSIMCGLGDEYNHLARADFRTLNYLYGHVD